MCSFTGSRTLILIALAMCPLQQAAAAGPRPSLIDQHKSPEPNQENYKLRFFNNVPGETISDQHAFGLPGGMGLKVTIKRTEGRPAIFEGSKNGTGGSGRIAYRERIDLPQKNHSLAMQITVLNPANANHGAGASTKRPRALQSHEQPPTKVVGHFEALPKDRIALSEVSAEPWRNNSGKMMSMLSGGRKFKLKLWRVDRRLVERETKQVLTLPDGDVWIRTYTPVYRNDKPKKQPKFQYTLITQSFISGKSETLDPEAAKPGQLEKGKTAARPRTLKRSFGLRGAHGAPGKAGRVKKTPTVVFVQESPASEETVNEPLREEFGSGQSIFAEPSMKVKALRDKSNRQQLSGNNKEVDNQWLNLRERGYGSRPLIASEQILGADYFSKTISGLKPGQHWLIIGPGRTPDEPDAYFNNSDQALSDKGYRFSGAARVTAIGTEPMTRSHKKLCLMMKGKYVYRAGKPLEKYTAKQIQKIGQADLVTDQFSAISYTDKLDLMIEKELGFVKKGGKLIFNLPSETEILDAAGVNVAAEYLKAITGVTTTINTIKSGSMTNYQVTMIKNDDNPFVPRLRLAADGYKKGSPPLRSFLFAGTSAAPAASVVAP